MWWKIPFDLAATVGWLRCLVAVGRRPARRFGLGWGAKITVLAIVVTGLITYNGLFVPIGAALVWWRVLVAGHDPFELPMADGRRVK